MWKAVFKTGTHVDSKGRPLKVDEALLDQIAQSYNPANHEAPVVIGHPAENAPAWGWVEELKRQGELLMAKMKLVPEFADMLEKGLFKKRSISLYPDMTLKHIGFLGATPPAVKGLPDVSFKEGLDATLFEFAEPGDFSEEDKSAQESRAKKYGIAIKEGGSVTKPGKYSSIPDDEFADPVNYRYPIDQAHCQAALSYWGMPKNREQYSEEEVRKITKRMLAAAKKHGIAVDESKWKFSERRTQMNFWERLKAMLEGKGISFRELFGSETPPVLFTEADLNAKIKAEVDKAKGELTTQFSEKENALKKEKEELAKQKHEARKKGITDFVEDLKKKGVLIPAMEKLGMGVTSFLQSISGIETVFDFAEAGEDGKKAKQTPLEFMQSFLSALPAQITFGEVAKDKDDPGPGKGNAKKLDKLAHEYMDKNAGVTLKDAYKVVSKEHPELVESR